MAGGWRLTAVETVYDAIVIGGGPAGATAALKMRREGLSVLVLDRAEHPRFHIGESMLPRMMALMKELGLEERLAKVPQVEKFGAEFAWAEEPEKSMHFRFDGGLPVGCTYAFNIERSLMDDMLLRAAQDEGAVVREGVTVKDVPVLRDGEVEVETSAGRFKGKWLVDASGQGSFLGKLLKTRRVIPNHRKIAFFGHFRNVDRKPMPVGGYPTIVMYKEGWFWMIPINSEVVSIGMVMDAEAAKKLPVKHDQALRWALPRVPHIARQLRNSQYPESNHILADFSYRCEPFAGPGYFLVGDAAVFVDPIFSTGACMAMMGGVRVAETVAKLVRGAKNVEALRRSYCGYVHNSSKHFFSMIHMYHQQNFRELFMEGEGPLEVHKAVISLLAGNVFPPSPPWCIRWRMWYFRACVWAQKHVALGPRRPTWSIFDAPEPGAPAPMPGVEVKQRETAGAV
jgi:flavin-dependent dehydrogenase